MPPVEAWRKVFVDEGYFEDTIHTTFGCIECHGGANSPDFDVAHETVVTDPSSPESDKCAACHSSIASHQAESLHYSLGGYDAAVYARSVPEHYEAIEEMQDNHCESCHTTCGQCHLSQPTTVGGGLLEGHVFQATPPMGRTCTGCHGSRVGNEYTGQHEELPADVHIRTARMSCTDCHSADEMHGIDVEAESRFDGVEMPACEDCHADVVNPDSTIEAHAAHDPDLLSCQTCHSITYDNCWSCHTEQTEEGQPYYIVDWSYLTFMIGRNPIQSEERPYEYVTLRHVPAMPSAFDFYGDDLLSNFDDQPTWVYATPHNIQRITPQNERCENCHTNDSIFLTEDKVVPQAAADEFADELPASLDPALYVEANREVFVDGAPPLPSGYEPAPEPTEEPEEEDEDLDLFE